MKKCKYMFKKLNDSDKKLINDTINMVQKTYDSELNKVGCGILASNGKCFFGISQLAASAIGFCAEPSARSSMLIDDKNNKIKTIVAIRGKTDPPSIIPPCGTCRETLRFYEPNAYVIILKKNGNPTKIKVKYLLPFPYYSTRYPEMEKNAMTNQIWCSYGHQN